MTRPTKERNFAMDVIRVVALFTMVSVHFFLFNGFYTQPIVGKRMYIFTVMRTGFTVCVPMFMILSGYLLNRKKLNKSYYKGIVKILFIYLIASFLCLIYIGPLSGTTLTAADVVFAILSFFSASKYSWYVEMYIGLFLMIPFLNILYHNLSSQKQKKVLIASFLILTALPSVLNIYNFKTADWWLHPTISASYQQLIPTWWTTLYPLTYYFLGCYLYEYKPKLKWHVNLLLLLGSVVLFGSFNYYRSYGTTFVSGEWQDWGALPTVIMAVLLFSLLNNLSSLHPPRWLSRPLTILSNACYGGYLVSYAVDEYFYAYLNAAVPDMPQRLNYYFLFVPLNFACSLILSMGINLLYSLLQRFVSLLRRMVPGR